jgi:hypothetical protein
LIIVKRLAILTLEPQVTEFQPEEPRNGRITLAQANNVERRQKTASRLFPVEVSAHTEEAHETS